MLAAQRNATKQYCYLVAIFGNIHFLRYPKRFCASDSRGAIKRVAAYCDSRYFEECTSLVMSSMIRRPLSLLLDAQIQQGTLRPPIILYRFVTLEDGTFLLEQILNSRRLLCLVRRLLGALKHCILSS